MTKEFFFFNFNNSYATFNANECLFEMLNMIILVSQ